MNSVSSAYSLDFLRLFQSKTTNKFSKCRKECKHSLAPKNRGEIEFQASVLFLLGFVTLDPVYWVRVETNVGISIN